MIKLIYTETALHFELSTAELEDWIEQRITFGTTTGEPIAVSSGRATFLLPEPMGEATAANFDLHLQGVKTVTVDRCDVDLVEIGLAGYWLATNIDSAEGIFVTQLPDRVESYLWQLWCSAKIPSAIRL